MMKRRIFKDEKDVIEINELLKTHGKVSNGFYFYEDGWEDWVIAEKITARPERIKYLIEQEKLSKNYTQAELDDRALNKSHVAAVRKKCYGELPRGGLMATPRSNRLVNIEKQVSELQNDLFTSIKSIANAYIKLEENHNALCRYLTTVEKINAHRYTTSESNEVRLVRDKTRDDIRQTLMLAEATLK